MVQEKLFTPANSFEIKGVNLTLLSFLLKTNDMEALEQQLIKRFEGKQGFFDGDSIVIDLTDLDRGDLDKPSDINFVRLIELLRQFNLSPVGVKSVNKKNLLVAQKYGLFSAPDLFSVSNIAKDYARNPAPLSKTTENLAPVSPTVHITDIAQETLIIDYPLRSGQQIYARARDVIVLATINVGAEIIADGNIHVYAPLRGRAIAGAKGNKKARIFTMDLNAELLSIAGVYRTAEDDIDDDFVGGPAEIRLESKGESDRLIITPLSN